MENKPITKDTEIKEVLRLVAPCKCNSCNNGCRFGSGFLAKGDLFKIAKFLNISEKELKEKHLEEVLQFNKKHLRPRLLKKEGKPYGKCTFFDEEKGCTIHEVKPLECRTSIQCKPYGEDLSVWFMINHLVDFDDPEAVRQLAQYEKSGGKTIPGGSLKENIPEEKLKKILSYEILK